MSSWFKSLVFLLILLLTRIVFAYPSAEVLGTSDTDPPFDLSVSSAYTGFVLISDDQLAISYSDLLRIVDMGSFELEADQPPAPDEEKGTDGRIAAITSDTRRSRIIASQEDGDILLFNLADITADPVSITLKESSRLGPIALDMVSNLAYVADNTDRTVIVVDLNSERVSSTIQLTIVGSASFTITDAVFVDETDEAYFTTSVGKVFYIASGGTAATVINVDPTGKLNLAAIAAFPSGSDLYVIDSTTPNMVRIDTSTHQIENDEIDISANPSPTDVQVTEVINPSGTYAYVSGSKSPGGGISVVNTSNDEVFNYDESQGVYGYPILVSATPSFLAASSAADDFVYMGYSTGTLGILTANPFIYFKSVVYSDGSSTLKIGQSVTITFQSDQTGTYQFRANGGVDASGGLLTDSSRNTSGAVTADTDTAVTFNYDDNSSAFEEGANAVFAFVTSGSNEGRRSTEVTVDTPPPNVVINSAGFGNTRVYVNFARLTEADISTYRIYLDPDPAAVLVKTDVSGTISQASSGLQLTGEISGLTNETIYYVAMEAVDTAGNISPSRTNTFADGTVATAMPEATVGPAGRLGQKSCALIPDVESDINIAAIICLAFAIGILFVIRRNDRYFWTVLLLVICALIFSSAAFAEDTDISESPVAAVDANLTESSQMWSFELKTGFWLPQNSVLEEYFTKCCNLITRIEGGVLFDGKYGIEGGAGFLYKSADALGVVSGGASQDRFNFILIPLETNFVWRADYFDWRYIIPFIRSGVDYVYFREGDVGATVRGFKFGLHGGGGIGINMSEFGDVGRRMDEDSGINDFLFTLEARYQWINNFGSGGLDLSGWVYSAGLLFEF